MGHRFGRRAFFGGGIAEESRCNSPCDQQVNQKLTTTLNLFPATRSEFGQHRYE